MATLYTTSWFRTDVLLYIIISTFDDEMPCILLFLRLSTEGVCHSERWITVDALHLSGQTTEGEARLSVYVFLKDLTVSRNMLINHVHM